MKVDIITPAKPGLRNGNRITAARWGKILGDLGHEVALRQRYEGAPVDLLVALHARKSADSVERFRREHPRAPLIVALTGTDVYADLHAGEVVLRSLELASAIVTLQPLATAELPEALRSKVTAIYQSAGSPRKPGTPVEDAFEVCVLGHLREVKDPFRTAEAIRLLPSSSRTRMLHVGAALSEDMAERARKEEDANPRYRWLGERSRSEALEILGRSRLLSLTSRMEGGANVVSEALVASVPVVSSRIPGSIGILGEDYPGYFPVGDTQALRALLLRAETDPLFYADLKARCERLRPLLEPARERAAWEGLLRRLVPGE